MTLEALANELLLELFEFLDVAELFRAFYGLNSRFNALLFTQCRAYRVNFHSILKYQSEFFDQPYLPLVANQIISLRLSDSKDESPSQTDFFFSSGLQLNQFIHLRSLLLCYINDEKILRKIIGDCYQLPLLTHLKVAKCYTKYMSSVDFSNSIWGSPTLTHCRLDMGDNFSMPTVVSLSIKYLSISCSCWWLSQTAGLFQQTPYLCHLHVPLNNLNDNPMLALPYFPSITMLKFSNVRSSKVMKVILLAVPQLTQLKVDAYYINCDGYQWEEIIDKYLPKLVVFRLRMHIQFRGEKNNEHSVDALVDSFRTIFWLEKHRWFIRCHYRSENLYTSILLYSLPYTFGDVELNMLTIPYKSTCPQDTDHRLYDRVNNLCYDSWLHENHSFVQFFNIRNLSIHLPLNKNFGEIIPTLRQLNSLTVLSAKENAQFQLQSLLDRAPFLYSLTIKSWPLSQIPVVKDTYNASIRRLDLRLHSRESGSFFSREECNTFICSPLGAQCEELLIQVEDHDSIFDLVNNMANLRMLHIEYQFSSKFLSMYNRYERKSEVFFKWLQDQLPTTCIISEPSHSFNSLKLWINLKKP